MLHHIQATHLHRPKRFSNKKLVHLLFRSYHYKSNTHRHNLNKFPSDDNTAIQIKPNTVMALSSYTYCSVFFTYLFIFHVGNSFWRVGKTCLYTTVQTHCNCSHQLFHENATVSSPKTTAHLPTCCGLLTQCLRPTYINGCFKVLSTSNCGWKLPYLSRWCYFSFKVKVPFLKACPCPTKKQK